MYVADDNKGFFAPSELKMYLYQPNSPYSFPINELTEFLENLLGAGLKGKVKLRPEFIMSYAVPDDEKNVQKEFAERMAKCRIEDIKTRELPAEKSKNLHVFYSAMELNLNEGVRPERSTDYLYFGPRLMQTFRYYLPESERKLNHLHLIFTDRLFCTWDDSDARYHARAVMLGFPHLISMPGIVEAPAKPREYYIKRHLYSSSGLSLDQLEAEFAGQYIIYKDERMLEVVKGYSLQALFYTLFNETFCNDKSCRLFNAHWQSELLNAQVKSGVLCRRHDGMLKDWLSK